MKSFVLVDRITRKEHIFLQGNKKSIGRSIDCDVQTLSGDKRVSRHHADAEYDSSGNFYVRDKKSRNGVYVMIDGEKTQVFGNYQIRSGESFFLGREYEMYGEKRDTVAEKNAEARNRIAETDTIDLTR